MIVIKNFRKLISLLLCILVVFTFASCKSEPEDVYANKTDNVNSHTFSLSSKKNSDGVSTLDNFKWSNNKITGLTAEGKSKDEIVIPANTESIDSGVFAAKNVKTKKVTFESDNNVDLNNTFTGSKTIEEVVLPKNQTEIKKDEFTGCDNLKKIEVSETTKIEEGAIDDNTSVVITKNTSTTKAAASNESSTSYSSSKTQISSSTTKVNSTTKYNNTTKKQTDKNQDTSTTRKSNNESTKTESTTKQSVTQKEQTTKQSSGNYSHDDIKNKVDKTETGKDFYKRIAQYIQSDDSSDALKRIKY